MSSDLSDAMFAGSAEILGQDVGIYIRGRKSLQEQNLIDIRSPNYGIVESTARWPVTISSQLLRLQVASRMEVFNKTLIPYLFSGKSTNNLSTT